MLPPVDTTVLDSNPKFNALYQDLCTNKLNPDGTTRIQDSKVLKEREEFAEELRKARVESARREIVASGLRELSFDGSELPEDLRELVAVIAAVLEGQVAEEDRDLLQEDVTKFKSNIRLIATALSHHLDRDATSLAAIVNPDDPPATEDLASTISNLKTSLSNSEDTLNTTRLKLATRAAEVHTLHRRVLHQSISILEQTLHGSVARGTKAKAEYLATVAEGMSKKLAVQREQLDAKVYSAEVREALRAKVEEIQGRARAVRRKVRETKETLEGYRKVGGLEGVAEEFGEVLAEQARVRGEIERLKARR